MYNLINWDGDEKRPYAQLSTQATLTEGPTPVPEGESLTFRDVCDGTPRTGRVLRTITSTEHSNEFLGKLPVTTLYLVAFESATRKDDLAVVYPLLIIRPPKPQP